MKEKHVDHILAKLKLKIIIISILNIVFNYWHVFQSVSPEERSSNMARSLKLSQKMIKCTCGLVLLGICHANPELDVGKKRSVCFDF